MARSKVLTLLEKSANLHRGLLSRTLPFLHSLTQCNYCELLRILSLSMDTWWQCKGKVGIGV